MRPTPPRSPVGRLLWILVGAILLYLDARRPWYAPVNARAVGSDLFLLLWAAFAIWLVYSGLRPRRLPGPSA